MAEAQNVRLFIVSFLFYSPQNLSLNKSKTLLLPDFKTDFELFISSGA